MATRQEREARIARERMRGHRARSRLHESVVARRRRDNVIVIPAVLVIVALAVVAQVLFFQVGPGYVAAPESSATPVPTSTPAAAPVAGQNVGDVPSPVLAEDRQWTGELVINEVPLAVTLDGALAPQAVASLVSLTGEGFFDGTPCHRLTTGSLSVLQCGDPTGTGTGGPGYYFGPIENAPEDGVYRAGTIAMANSGDPYSNGSQFFIVYADSELPPSYTVVGSVTSGLDELVSAVVDAGVEGGASDGAPAVPTSIDSFSVQ